MPISFKLLILFVGDLANLMSTAIRCLTNVVYQTLLYVITHDDNIKLYFKNDQKFRPQGAFVSGYVHDLNIVATDEGTLGPKRLVIFKI